MISPVNNVNQNNYNTSFGCKGKIAKKILNSRYVTDLLIMPSIITPAFDKLELQMITEKTLGKDASKLKKFFFEKFKAPKILKQQAKEAARKGLLQDMVIFAFEQAQRAKCKPSTVKQAMDCTKNPEEAKKALDILNNACNKIYIK